MAKIAMLPKALSTCWPMADSSRMSKSPKRPKMKNAATVLTAMKAMPTGRPANIRSRVEPKRARRIQYHSIWRGCHSGRRDGFETAEHRLNPGGPYR